MRCLYCGKELALLKRLTSGGDFCSEAHRQSYQDQFNELALGRLEQARVVPEFPEDEIEAVEVGVGASGQGSQAHGDAQKQRRGGSGGSKARPKFLAVQGPGPASFVPDWFDPFAAEEAVLVGHEPPELGGLKPQFPARDPYAVAAAMPCQHATPHAGQVRWTAANQPVQYTSGARGRAPEARDFSRTTTPPIPQLRQGVFFVPAAMQDEQQVSIAPRPPGSPTRWQARTPEFAPVDVSLGPWARLEGNPVGSEAWILIRETVQASDDLATLERAVSTPDSTMLRRVTTPPAASAKSQVVPEPVTKPVPLILNGVAPTAVKPTVFLNAPAKGGSTGPELRIPGSGNSPLRPVMLLGSGGSPATLPQPTAQQPPAPQPAAPQPAATHKVAPKPAAAIPVAAAAPKAQDPAPRPDISQSPNRAVRGTPGKVRRDVRVIPAAQPAANRQPEAPKPEPARPVPVAAKPEVHSEAAPTSVPPAASLAPTSIPAPAPADDYQALHLPPEGRFASMSGAVKIGIAVALLALAGGLGYWAMSGGGSKTKPVNPNASTGYEVGMQVPNTGWIENWAPESSGKRISLLKGSQPLTDYRIEFQAQIETKAIGWMYRGLNPRNFYVAKLEALKPGLEPTIALVHYAVIDGKAEPRVEKILPIQAHAGMMYKIRFEAVGPRFTAWVQDQKVDEWRDTRLGSGGIGMYSEGTEAALVNGIVNVTALVPK